MIFLMTAYLDNSATTPVCSEAVEAMKTAVTELWGNPSSLHQKGIEADEMLENARSNVARRLFCRDDECISPPAELRATILPFRARLMPCAGAADG